MSFHRKVTVLFLFLIVATPAGLLWARRHYRPKPVPIPPREEVTITILPGWDLRDVAAYLVNKGFASTSAEVYSFTGTPARMPVTSTADRSNFEGYLAPETYRVYKDAKLFEVIQTLQNQRSKELVRLGVLFGPTTTSPTDEQIKLHREAGNLLIKASLLEKEARTLEDKKLVADILDRRLEKGWPLQLDSTVHYAIDKSGTVFTTEKDRSSLSLWNTYRYPGLPPTPICNPGVESIRAALEPTPNQYWFFLSGNDGKMHYAKTLEEHASNRYRFLR